jgi:hypothetical protein
MELDFRAFAFIITLAAVINGLGIVRWLSALAEYLRRSQSLSVKHYWVYALAAGFQFMVHILLWWSLWGTREAGEFNFLSYLYLLTGPILLFLGTTLLVPDVGDDGVDLRAHYFSVRRIYSTVLLLLWIWVIFLWPVLAGAFAPTAPILVVFTILAGALRVTANPIVHAAVFVVYWLLLVAFVALFAMQLGGVGALMS